MNPQARRPSPFRDQKKNRDIYSADAIEATIQYLHLNPVRKNLCQRATDYRWSSCRYYEQNTTDPDLPTIKKADPMWLDKSGTQTE